MIRLFLCILSLMTVIKVDSQLDSSTTNISYALSMVDIQYIYNRAFDIALRDYRNGYDCRSIFVAPLDEYDTILITVDPVLNPGAFGVQFVEEFKEVDFTRISVQEKFDNTKITNSFKIAFKHYDVSPILAGNHLMHVVFSDLYMQETKFFVGVLLEQKIKEGAGVNFKDIIILEMERCDEKYFVFRKIFNPLDNGDIIKKTYSRDLDDRKCN